ncbi:unnamed protein product [Arabidopsis halleri]
MGLLCFITRASYYADDKLKFIVLYVVNQGSIVI